MNVVNEVHCTWNITSSLLTTFVLQFEVCILTIGPPVQLWSMVRLAWHPVHIHMLINGIFPLWLNYSNTVMLKYVCCSKTTSETQVYNHSKDVLLYTFLEIWSVHVLHESNTPHYGRGNGKWFHNLDSLYFDNKFPAKTIGVLCLQ